MAIIGRGKEELVIELAEARGELGALRNQVKFLEEQLRRTQDALIAKEAPEAYQDQKAAEEAARPISEAQLEHREKIKAKMELEKKWLEEMEQPLFRSAEDMQSMLLSILNKPSEGRSLHGDLES